jgi:hypothetical protein
VSAIAQAVALALAVGAVAQIGSSSQISAPLRLALAKHKKPWSRWTSDLIGCAFCSGVWLSAIGTAIVRPWVVHSWLIIEFGVTFLAVSAAAMLPVLWIRKALKA